MAKMYIMGKYSEKAFLGFLKDPTTDRKAAVEKLTSAAGGKMLSMDIVRGPYDFIVVAEMANFETFAAVKLAVESTGAVRELVALEAMDLTGAAKGYLNPVKNRSNLKIVTKATLFLRIICFNIKLIFLYLCKLNLRLQII